MARKGMPIGEAARRLGLAEEEVKEMARKQPLMQWGRDYWSAGRAGLMFDPESIGKIRGKADVRDEILRARPDEVTWGVVHKNLPPNERRVWVLVPGHEGRGVCNLPKRLARRYRVPGKKVPVRHVEGDVFQVVLLDWRNEG